MEELAAIQFKNVGKKKKKKEKMINECRNTEKQAQARERLYGSTVAI